MKRNIYHIAFMCVLLFVFANMSVLAQDTPPADSQNVDKSSIDSKIIDSPSKNKRVEVYVDEGMILPLQNGDMDVRVIDDKYVILPLSPKLKAFLQGQNSPLKSSTLSSSDSTVEFQHTGDKILFYYAGRNSKKSYDKVAPNRFLLTKETIKQNDKNEQESQEVYVINDYRYGISDITQSSCQIAKSSRFMRDRVRSELVIDLNSRINPRIYSQEEMQFYLVCEKLPKGYYFDKSNMQVIYFYKPD